MKYPGDSVTVNELENSWVDVLTTFDRFIEGGRKEGPVGLLIRYIIEKGYSKNLYGGSAVWFLLISLPKEMTIDFTKMLRIETDWIASTVKFIYHCELPRPKEPEWSSTCQFTEIIDTFEYFLTINDDWGKIKTRNT
jgi:hypothetical protein